MDNNESWIPIRSTSREPVPASSERDQIWEIKISFGVQLLPPDQHPLHFVLNEDAAHNYNTPHYSVQRYHRRKTAHAWYRYYCDCVGI